MAERIKYRTEQFGGLMALLVLPSLFAMGVALSQTPAAKRTPIGKFITVTSPVDDVLFGRVMNVALNLQRQAQQEQRKAILVLEITPGSSPFYQVQGLAKFLRSNKLNAITTVAWVPKTVTGNNVVLALAADEIVMAEDAELGDIGRGKPLDDDERHFIVGLASDRHNVKLSAALAIGMIDRDQAVVKIQRKRGTPGRETVETEVVTPDELRELQRTKVFIGNPERIKEAGDLPLFRGGRMRRLDLLVAQTAESREDVARLYGLPRESLREEPGFGKAPQVELIRIKGVIDPLLATFVERQIRRVVAAGANTIIFEIESPGGYLTTSEELADLIADLKEENIRTVAYIPKKAISGAAIVALGCDEIYLAPHGEIGDAEPIGMKQGGPFEHVPEKLVTELSLYMRGLAARKKRPPALLEAMIQLDLQVYRVTNANTQAVWYMSEHDIHAANEEWTRGPLVPESRKGLLLAVDGNRAHELLLAEAPVADLADLQQRLGIPHVKLVAVGRTWIDTLVYVLNSPIAMFFLVVLGVALLYLELHFTSGLMGIGSALCFALFFWSKVLGGTAGWLEVVLFLLGVVCLALEIFVIPGFGVFGVSGILLVMASMVMAGQTWGNLKPGADMSNLSHTVGTLSASIVSVVLLAMLMSRYLPHVPLLGQLILSPPGATDDEAFFEPELRPELTAGGGSDANRNETLLGEQGVTMSILRPAGKARFGDRFVDVVSEGPYIPSGTTIEVISARGNHVVVRQV